MLRIKVHLLNIVYEQVIIKMNISARFIRGWTKCVSAAARHTLLIRFVFLMLSVLHFDRLLKQQNEDSELMVWN